MPKTAKLLTIQKAADKLGVATKTLRRWEARGVLIPIRTVGNQRRYTLEQVLAYKNGGKNIPATPIPAHFLSRNFPNHPDLPDSPDNSFNPLAKIGSFFCSEIVSKGIVPITKSVVKNPLFPVASFFVFSLVLFGFMAIKTNLKENLAAVFLKEAQRDYQMAAAPNSAPYSVNYEVTGNNDGSRILGIEDISDDFTFNVNVPALFYDTVNIDGVTTATTINAGTITADSVTADNLLYSVKAGSGISVSTGQTPTITNSGVLSLGGSTGALSLSAGSGISVSGLTVTNSDLGSSQNIFKKFAVTGQSNVEADANADTLTLAGSGITITTAASSDTITFTAIDAGWVDDGTVVRLSASTDSVGMGTSTPAAKLDLAGTGWLRGGTGYTGLYVNSSGNLGIGTTSPTTGYVLDISSGNLRVGGTGYFGSYVGIGTTAPAYNLDIVGTLQITGTSFTGLKMPYGASQNYVLTTDGSGNASWTDSTGGGSYGAWTLTGSTIYPNAQTYSVSIGSTSVLDATAKLTVLGTAWLRGSSTTNGLYVNSSGNVGIGTTAPSAALHVGTGGTADYANGAGDIYIQNDLEVDGTIYGSISGGLNPGQTQGSVLFQGASGITADAPNFYWNDSTNALGIGTSSPTSGYALDISTGNLRIGGTGYFASNVGIGTTTPTGKLEIIGAGTGVKSLLVRGNTSNDANIQEWQNASGTQLSYVDSAGALYAPYIGAGNTPSSTMAVRAEIIAGSGTNYGTYSKSYLGGAPSGANSYGIQAISQIQSGSGTINYGVGGHFSSSLEGAASITNLMGVYVSASNSAGTADNVYGLYIDNIANASAGGNYAILTNNGNIVFNEGGNSASDLRIEGDTDSGLFFTDASTDRIGIGTTGPTSKLSIAGGVGIGTTSATSLYHSTAIAPDGGLIVEGAVGIGTTTPTTGYELDVAGDLRVGNTAYFAGSAFLSDGTASAPGLAFASDTNSGLYRISADKIGLITGGNAAYGLTIDSSGLVGIGTTAPTYILDVVSSSTTGGFQLTADSVTTGTGALFSFDGLSTGKGMYLSSTSTALSSGNLLALDWSPTATTTATGDLLYINIGSSANIGNILNIADSGSSLFSVSETTVTSNLPTNFTSAGDVIIAYDISFTNETASFIKSAAPLTIEAGESFENNDLALKTYGVGGLVFDAPGGLTLLQNQNWSLGVGTTSPIALNIQSGLLNLDTTNNRVGIGTTAPAYTLDVNGTVNIGGTATFSQPIFLSDGTLSGTTVIPSLAFSNDTNSGLYRLASDKIGLITGGTATYGLTINASGQVGIGTTAPTTQLHVSAADAVAIKATSTTTSQYAVFEAQNDGSETVDIGVYDSAAGSTLFGVARAGLGFHYSTNPFAMGTLNADNFYLGTNNASVMTLTSAGLVGIGTTAPGAMLDISKVDYGATPEFIRLSNFGSNSGSKIAWRNAADTITGQISSSYDTASGWTMRLGTWNATEALILNSSGNVGIGNSTPAYKLDVNGTLGIGGTAFFSSLTSFNSLVGIGTTAPASGYALDVSTGNLRVGGTAYFVSHVGIGTTSPGSVLPNSFTSHADSRILEILTSTNGDAGVAIRRGTTVGLDLWADGNAGGTYIDSLWTGAGGKMYFRTRTSGTLINAMMLDSAGNLAIGNTNPIYKLDVTGSLGVSSTAYFASSVGIGTTAPGTYALNVNGTLGVGVGNTASTATIGSLAGTGNRAIYADSTGLLTESSSDIRLKENITDITLSMDVLDALSQLRGVYYNWNTDVDRAKNLGTQKEVGMIAQEVERVLPELVGTDSQGYKTLDYAKMTGFLVEVDKAQQTRIEGLEFNVDSLKSLNQSGLDSGQAATPTITPTPVVLDTQTIEKLIVSGGLTVSGPAEFNGPAIFKALAEFIDKVLFRNDVEFAGKAIFNSDTGGFAKIPVSGTFVEIVYDKEYAANPIVSVNLKTEMETGKWKIATESAKGFKIEIDTPQEKEIDFSWIALAVKDAKTIVGPTPTPTPVPTASPAPTISPIPPTETPVSTITSTPPISPIPSESPIPSPEPTITPEPTTTPTP